MPDSFSTEERNNPLIKKQLTILDAMDLLNSMFNHTSMKMEIMQMISTTCAVMIRLNISSNIKRFWLTWYLSFKDKFAFSRFLRNLWFHRRVNNAHFNSNYEY